MGIESFVVDSIQVTVDIWQITNRLSMLNAMNNKNWHPQSTSTHTNNNKIVIGIWTLIYCDLVREWSVSPWPLFILFQQKVDRISMCCTRIGDTENGRWQCKLQNLFHSWCQLFFPTAWHDCRPKQNKTKHKQTKNGEGNSMLNDGRRNGEMSLLAVATVNAEAACEFRISFRCVPSLHFLFHPFRRKALSFSLHSIVLILFLLLLSFSFKQNDCFGELGIII